ncbi:MAG TPA: prolyl oligopeptidase family serine peptidase, partial [Myxococcota bacterium]|nr:prolyl oligopeptidase family serine peptidase [Myxococcota bacterium]
SEPNGKTILWIHGGPVAAWGHRWHGRWCARLMASHGFRVVLPNPAGSTGYGLAWVDDVWGNSWGDQCYRDVMAVADYLEDQGIRSADTVVMGGSFGGYMTNWIGGQTDRFALLITHASLYSLSGFQGDTDMPSWWELMTGVSPGDPALDRFSPARNVANWKTPTLILHGEKDYRVPIGEGLALFEALTRQGTDAELVVFPDENHWILKPRNIIAWYGAVLDFIDRKWPGRKWPSRPIVAEAG